jgi:uncharacterized membrane protein (UPF0127 family)
MNRNSRKVGWMKKFGLLVVLAAAGLWVGFSLGGCNKGATTATGPVTSSTGASAAPGTPAAPEIPGLPTQAQPKLRTMQLWVGSKAMTAELALSPTEEETGMMFRTNMGPNDGMLFVLPALQRASFWMMNCDLPLSAAYIGPDGTILEIHNLEPHNTNAVVAASDNVQYVLETPQGWFKSNGIPAGTAISTEKGSLRDVFKK